MEDLRTVVASNIVDLRSKAGMKQAELAEKINYSDKSISKWERAESVPDVAVLKSIADIFGVSLDYMVTDHNSVLSKEETAKRKQKIRDERKAEKKANGKAASATDHGVIAAIVTIGILSLDIAIFFILLAALDRGVWFVIPAGVAVACIPLLVFNSLWGIGRNNKYIIIVLIAALITMIYLIFVRHNIWEIFLLIIPSVLIVLLSFRVKKSRSKTENDVPAGVE